MHLNTILHKAKTYLNQIFEISEETMTDNITTNENVTDTDDMEQITNVTTSTNTIDQSDNQLSKTERYVIFDELGQMITLSGDILDTDLLPVLGAAKFKTRQSAEKYKERIAKVCNPNEIKGLHVGVFEFSHFI